MSLAGELFVRFQLTFCENAPCTELPVHLRNRQNTDPIEGPQEEKVCLEDDS